jgi:hypothetical protein
MLDAYLRCPRYYYARHVLGITGRGVKIAAQFGIAIHEGLDVHYDGGNLEAIINAFFKHFDHEGDRYRSREVGVKILTYYHDMYPVEGEPFEVIHIEKGFEIVLGVDKAGNPVHYYGRIDLVGNFKDYGVIVIDHKTTTVMTDAYMESKDPNRQATGYIITADEYYDNVYGFMLNGVGIPRVTKKDGIKDPDIRREVTTRNKFEKAEWVNETMHIISQIDSCHESGIWPESAPHACRKWNIPCTYLSLCRQKVPLDRIRVYDSEFVEDRWVPFANKE